MLATIVSAALIAQATPGRDIGAEIMAANAIWADAIRRQDTARLSRVMSPDYRLITPTTGAKGIDLTRWTRSLMRLKLNHYVMKVTKIEPVGRDVAITLVVAQWDSTLPNGKPLKEWFTARDTWVFRNGRWIAAARRVLELKTTAG